ncbi:hypothetical protein F0562_013962 [Nyssa sinensis]|uniref:SGNH hydrolase-type esterase domain-containing protein n=1 Tax=Nyssa sinensis TaxID=561372 RepID=A0A5J4ZL74_9ASTE|nr:hypothetical protein F0562_013962 [Nyssa sinensis]
MFMMSLLVVELGPLVRGQPQVPCYFIFGDSIFDNGNNNGLLTMAKVNFPPYGIDFPDGPTGRFTNGRNMADIIAEKLGFKNYIPPFATASPQEVLTGVNYGSGGAGIRNETGKHLGGRISLNEQLLHHQVIISRIALLLGSKDLAREHLSKCIYTIGMGNNDYINNYLMPQFYPTSHLYTPQQYAAVLIHQYFKQIKTLYNQGARKVALFGIGLIGCIPAEVTMYGTNGSACVDWINNYVQLFNDKLVSLVDELNNDLTDAKFIYINSTGISSGDPSAIGLTVANAPCCDVSTNYGKGQCIPQRVPCSDRSTYVFWDAFHPTEIVNVVSATRAYSALSPTDAYPFDIRGLAQLSL